jgi:uncharacterized protein YjbI with pentapeptide repeats
VDFSGAILSGTDFRGASLIKADFAGANLYQADLAGANLEEADFRETCLVNVIGLDQARNIEHATFTDAIIPENLRKILGAARREGCALHYGAGSELLN